MRIRMLIAVAVVIILQFIGSAIVAGARILSTGDPPGGENPGLSGMGPSLNSLFGAIRTGIADWMDHSVHLLAG